MAIEVFNRYEKKFIVRDDAYLNILSALNEYMEPDEYNKRNEFYTISNLYYDTEDNHLIRHSLSKPKYKQKLRLRAYGVPSCDDKVYLEIKKKVCGLVNKRRSKLKLSEAYEFAATGIKPPLAQYMNYQVIDEIAYILKLHTLVPKLYLAYDRRAFFCRESRDLRITFDFNVRVREYDLRLESGDYGESLLERDVYLMEVKAEKSIPVWLSRILSENKVFSTGFSKYGAEHQRRLYKACQSKGGEDHLCLKTYLTQRAILQSR